MTNFKRITALLIAWVLVLSAVLVGVPAVAAAEKPVVKHGTQTWVNPLYEGRIDLSDEWTRLPKYEADPNGEYLSEEAAAQIFRQHLANRDAQIQICVSSIRDGSEVIEYLLDQAVAHTGNAWEGDYIYYHLGGYNCQYSYSRPSNPGDPVNYTITYQVRYLSTPAEEVTFVDAAEALLASLGLEGKTDFEKIRIIHDYLSANISYDYSDDDDTTKYTAYGALIEKKAVCQGYANLFYYLALRTGVDNRIISGIGGGGPHAWNIVKLNGLYYNLDATWDSSGWGDTWFLCGQNDFPDHIRDAAFETAAFHKKYPMAMTKYDPSNPEIPDIPQETEPAPTEPTPTEPTPTEPTPTEPTPTEPAPTEPKPTEPVCKHDWREATCKAPKTCRICGAKTGKPAAHTYDDNVDGTCNVCNVRREEVEIRKVVHMFRMYNPNTGEHFYTGSEEERDNLIGHGWHYEGVGFTFPANTGDPVYRLFHEPTGEHLYTMDKAEKEKLEAEGWNYEGIAFNSAYDTEAVQHRLHNPNATVGAYHFTFSLEEKQNLIDAGWEYQGIGWYSCWK